MDVKNITGADRCPPLRGMMFYIVSLPGRAVVFINGINGISGSLSAYLFNQW